jgi:hypothetical protein
MLSKLDSRSIHGSFKYDGSFRYYDGELEVTSCWIIMNNGAMNATKALLVNFSSNSNPTT